MAYRVAACGNREGDAPADHQAMRTNSRRPPGPRDGEQAGIGHGLRVLAVRCLRPLPCRVILLNFVPAITAVSLYNQFTAISDEPCAPSRDAAGRPQRIPWRSIWPYGVRCGSCPAARCISRAAPRMLPTMARGWPDATKEGKK